MASCEGTYSTDEVIDSNPKTSITESLDNSTAHSPSTEIAKPENFAVTNVTSTSFQLSWAAQSGAFDSFLLTIKDVNGVGRPLRISHQADQHTADVTGLVPDTDYKIDLYGIVQGQLSKPLTEITRTGILQRLVITFHVVMLPRGRNASCTSRHPITAFRKLNIH